ncbi:DsbA family protein [Phaeovulum sp. NW3]|uniref:DsbA family protein n=1 Tax=Phaeovulum sp. NW3 TaxID=2934933 RepID=UPI00201FC962|nr:DsbA family protein [Phaeovulum sp. NW3]MCL7465868.1 DsbA family protein [Phaeovulum sp. NW3]
MTTSSKLLAAALAAVVLAGGGWWVTRGAAPVDGALSLAAVAQEATDAQILPDMVMGQQDAPVTLIEYASFTCPHCATFHENVVDRLKADYVDTGKVRFIHREVYFDKFGLWAGLVASCGGAPKYFAIADMIYDTQRDWIGNGQDASVAANLRKIGLKAGLSEDQLNACLNDQARAQQMVATYQKNATADDISATPTLVINGTKHSNMSYEDLKAILDQELAK